MADTIFRIICNIIDMLELFFVAERLFHNQTKGKIRYIIYGILFLLATISVRLYAGDMVLLTNFLLYAFLFIFLFEGKILLQLARCLAVYLYTDMVEGIVIVTGFFIRKNFHMNAKLSAKADLLFVILSAILALFIIDREQVQKFLIYFKDLKWYQYIVIAVIAFCSMLLLAICAVSLGENNSGIGMIQSVVTIMLLGATFVGIVWLTASIYSRNYYIRQNQLKEEIISTQQKYYQKIYECDKEVRSFRHDIRSQLGCLQLLLSEGKITQAEEYLEKMEFHLNRTSIKRYHTGNEILDVVLSQSCAEAAEKGVDVEITGDLGQTDFMDTYDLCILFSNAIRNGAEACEKLAGIKKQVKVTVVKHQKAVFFQFSNPASSEMYLALQQGRTTKKDDKNHGFGVENIQMAAERNGGGLEYRYQDGILVLEVYFNL